MIKTIVTYPKPASKTKPLWLESKTIDSQLYEILSQVYTSHDNGLNILTAVGLRTALDRATEVLGIDPGKPFERSCQFNSKAFLPAAPRALGAVA